MNCTPAQTNGVLYSTLAADADLADLVELFVSEMPQRIEQLLNCFQQPSWEQLGRTAHQLKGAAGSYGFHDLTPFAANLEAAVRGKASLEQVEQSLNELVLMCRSVRAGLPE
jgi:histidine phosphotransfer protein HptB